MKYTPYRHQEIARDFLLRHDHACLFLGMGLGKTVTTLTVLAEHLWNDFTVRKCLVIAPKNVAETTVEKTAEETANCDTPFNKQDLITAHETPDKPVMKSLRVEFAAVHNWVDLYTRVMGLPELNGAKVALSVEW